MPALSDIIKGAARDPCKENKTQVLTSRKSGRKNPIAKLTHVKALWEHTGPTARDYLTSGTVEEFFQKRSHLKMRFRRNRRASQIG